MSRYCRFSILALAALAAVAVTIVVGVVPSQGVGAAPNPEADGIANLAACYARTGRMAVELVVDQSKSLRKTDSTGRRVELARAISQAFAQVGSVPIAGHDGRIDIRAVAFGTRTVEVSPWVTLDRKGSDPFISGLDQFRERDDDDDTDYVDALGNARADVLGRSAEIAPSDPSSVCRAVVWFTDGEFDFDPTGLRPGWASDLVIDSEGKVRQALQRGTELLCSPGGLADQYRTSETYLLTAALTSDGFDEGDARLLRSVTTGEGGACGSVDGRPTGSYFSADDIGRLLLAIVPPVLGPPPPTSQSVDCVPGAPCERSFPIDAAVIAANLFVDADAPGRLSLVGPTGQAFDISPQTADGTVDTATVSSRAADRTRLVLIDLAKATETASGEWKVRLEPEQPGRLTIWVSRKTGLGLVAGDIPAWTRGQPGAAEFRVVDSEGAPLPAGTLASSQLQAVVTHGSSPSQTITPEISGSTVIVKATPALDEPAAVATVAISGDVTTAAGDRVPVNASRDVKVKVAGAPSPQERLDLGVVRVERQEERDARGRQPVLPLSTRRSITLTGAPDGNGEVCLTGAAVTSGGQALRVAPKGDRCVVVPAGGTTQLPVVVTSARPSAGTVDGVLRLTTRSTTSGSVTPVELPVGGEVIVKPGDPILSQGTFWGLVLGSFGMAAALWIGLSWWTSRLNDPTVIKGFRLEIAVRPALSSDERPSLKLEDWEYLEADGPRGARFQGLAIRAPLRIFSAQDAVATMSGHLVHGPLGSDRGRRATGGRLAHQIQGQWVFVTPLGMSPPAEGLPIEGDLVFFVREDAIGMESDSGGLLDRAQDELCNRYGDIRARLERLAPEIEDNPVSVGAGAPSPPEDHSSIGGLM